MYEATLNGNGRRVCAVTDSKLAQQIVDVGFDGSFRDSEVGGDFLVGAAGNDALKDCELAGSELLGSNAIGEFFGDCGRRYWSCRRGRGGWS